MEPIVLTMTAFGPYKYTETIDFRELQANKLFVISGNTGAGKTTIFDAICFALYGSASGSDRDSHTMLRSDFAGDDTHTSVQLTFALNQRIYRVFRQLGHIKQGNKSKTGDRIEFYEQRGDTEVPCVDRQNVSDIDEKIESLLGLTEDQFKQIVMLPQGEFRKLLTSKTENKEAILRRLFKTESYQELNERLKVKRDAAEETFRRLEHTRDMYIEHIHATLPERENSLLFDVLDEEHYNTHQVIAGLEEEVNFYAKRMQTDEAHYKKAYAAHDRKQKQFHQAQMINEKFQTLDEKRRQLDEQTKKVPAFEEKEKQLQLAERASQITLYEKQTEDWRADEKEKEQAIRKANNKKALADEALQKTQHTYEHEKNKQAKRDEATKQLEKLQGFLPIVREIDSKRKALNQLQSEVKQASKDYEKAAAEFQSKEQAMNKHDEKMRKMELEIEHLPEKEEQLKEMRENHKLLKRYMDLNSQHQTLTDNLSKHESAVKQAEAAYTTGEQKWLTNQASILASHLHEGKACPVCGSLTHPHRAESEHALTTREALDSLRADWEKKNKSFLTVQANVQACNEQIKEVADELRVKHIPLEDAERENERVINEGKRLKKEVEHAKQTREKLKQLRQSYEKLISEKKQWEVTKEQYRETFQKKNLALTEEQTAFDVQIRDIPEGVRVLQQLEKQIATTQQQKETLEANWEKAQTNLLTAKDEQTKAASQVTHANRQYEETATRREKAEQAFQQALKEASFSTVERYQNSKMSPERQRELKAEIDSFKQTMETLKQQINELIKELEEQSRSDLKAMEKELTELKEKMETALQRRDQSRTIHQETIKLHEDITKANENLNAQDEKRRVVADLHDMMRGQNSQKISFERYLQIEYLEQIINTANLRLKNVSNGQFLLMRSDRQESYGRQGGLGFDIYDAYTGQTRDVKTLSGGEKFNASLCLALGMSDVIQSFQGKVSMKTMFIDEGFGSLDEESLQKALDALIELQKSGRTIGVISHVEELKEILPAALEVKKTKEGSSRTEFVLQ